MDTKNLARKWLAPMFLAVIGASGVSAATVDDLRIHYSVTGKNAVTVFLVHGWTCNETVWSEQVPELAKKYRVVTLDLPGHGQTDAPKDGKYSMDQFARAIESVRSEIGVDRVVLAGHSMGTPVVLRYAKLYPQHTIALILVDGVMPPAERPNSPAGEHFGGPDDLKNREQFVNGMFSVLTTADMRAKIMGMMLGAAESTAVGAMNATWTPDAITTELPPVPVLGIYAGHPGFSREQVLARYPNAEYVQIPETGHFLMMEKPAEFNAILLSFLGKQRY